MTSISTRLRHKVNCAKIDSSERFFIGKKTIDEDEYTIGNI